MNRKPGVWISVEDSLPDYLDGEDYSANVFTTDGHSLCVMSRHYDYDAEGWMWANCYGDIHGDAELDDDYSQITHWMPLPALPVLKKASEK
jgi:hypothetical protein